mgnify:CR=1 FL=1
MEGKKEKDVKKDTDVNGANDPHAVRKDHAITAADPAVSLHGIPGFHHKEEEGDHVHLANMALDKDEKGRVDTGTGDQPSNSGGSRFATPSGAEE